MKQRLDGWLNRFSMYRLVSISLGVLLGYAVFLSLLGQLSFSPPELLASAAVLVLAVYAANILFGRLFGVATHDESTFITGLILFFILTPTIEPRGLIVLAVIGVIAAASKFLLAIRGRHIFNPAAIAAVVAGGLGLAFASWWVATPVLLPVTLVTALLIIYKTRRHVVASVFLGLATTLVVLVLLGYGTPWQEAVGLLGSWPLLFFAGFMLTEPLTLPARRWQQIVEAGLVAILFAVPLHIGELTMTPALALVIGNFFAFAVTRRQKIQLVFKEHRPLTPSSDEYVFVAERPLWFEAGQYAELTLLHPHKDGRGVRRSFSMTSLPGKKEVTFGVKFYEPASSFKQALRRLKPGMIVTSTGTSGEFTLPRNTTDPLLFIAGGIGITPFISQLQYVRQTSQVRNIVVVYAISHPAELAYASVLKTSGCRLVVVCKDPLPKGHDWVAGRYESIDTALSEAVMNDLKRRQAYVSGPPEMVRSTKALLRRSGVTKIATDYFTGY